MRENYIEDIKEEIIIYGINEEIRTLYFGGGTPSLINPKDVKKIIDLFNTAPKCEITLEVNPGTVDLKYLKEIYDAGVNRLSIGIQSFNDKMLENLGRIHTKYQAVETIYGARRAGFKNISIDLMFALPSQSMEDLRKDLETAVKMETEHISIYSLSYEENTPLYNKRKSGLVVPLDEETEAVMYETVIDFLKREGYNHYEISNFSKPGFESRHNINYWNNNRYFGIGAGASGYLGDIRYKNKEDISIYRDKISKRELPIGEKTEISENERLEYSIILGLRLLEKGFNIEEELNNHKNSIKKHRDIVDNLVEKGLLEIYNGNIRLTERGLMTANDVMAEFIEV